MEKETDESTFSKEPGGGEGRGEEGAESGTFRRLAELVKTLRGENGCPWDKKQTAQSMVVKMLEETYELVDAVSNGEPEDVCEELGDVLFHIFFIARLFEEKGEFGIEAVSDGITGKMIRRHPHVFDNIPLSDPEEVKRQWHVIKQNEKSGNSPVSILDSIPRMLPALMRAYRISERAAREGFDWSDLSGVMAKVMEEWHELEEAFERDRKTGENRQAVQMEFGDLLFSLVNVARFLGINPETALTESTQKFESRFRHMERAVKESHREMARVSEKEKNDLWEKAKAAGEAQRDYI